jgi:hypothetical protein
LGSGWNGKLRDMDKEELIDEIMENDWTTMDELYDTLGDGPGVGYYAASPEELIQDVNNYIDTLEDLVCELENEIDEKKV